MSFENLGLSPWLLLRVSEEGYETATAIQSQAIPSILEGQDLLGCAQTGTGKTAAFALPTLHRISESVRGQGNDENPSRKGQPRTLARFARWCWRRLANWPFRLRRVSECTASTRD